MVKTAVHDIISRNFNICLLVHLKLILVIFIHHQETMNDALSDLVRNINQFRTDLADTKEKTEKSSDEVMSKLLAMRRTVEELKEKTWELDTSTRNNLVFYGIKEDAGSGNTEWAVKEVFEVKDTVKAATEDIEGDQVLATHLTRYSF